MDDLYKYKEDHAGDRLSRNMWRLVFWIFLGLVAFVLVAIYQQSHHALQKADMLSISETRVYKSE